MARFIPETYEEEDTLPVIDHGIQDRYGRGNYNAAVTYITPLKTLHGPYTG